MKRTLIILCIMAISGMDSAFAVSLGGVDPGAINTQYMKDIRTFDARSRAKQRSAIIEKRTGENAQTVSAEVSVIKSVKFVNNNNFSSSQLLPIIQDKINQPMTVENISAIRKSIMKFYQANGFYSAVAIIAASDNTSGELVIQIDEGTKNSITVE